MKTTAGFSWYCVPACTSFNTQTQCTMQVKKLVNKIVGSVCNANFYQVNWNERKSCFSWLVFVAALKLIIRRTPSWYLCISTVWGKSAHSALDPTRVNTLAQVQCNSRRSFPSKYAPSHLQRSYSASSSVSSLCRWLRRLHATWSCAVLNTQQNLCVGLNCFLFSFIHLYMYIHVCMCTVWRLY